MANKNLFSSALARFLPQTDAVLAGLLDLRLPLTFNLEDCALIARIIRADVLAVGQGGVAPLEAAAQMGD